MTDAEWLEEAATYFENRSTGGEDMAYWANFANAERCRSIAVKLRQEKPVAYLVEHPREGKDLQWVPLTEADISYGFSQVPLYRHE